MPENKNIERRKRFTKVLIGVRCALFLDIASLNDLIQVDAVNMYISRVLRNRSQIFDSVVNGRN
jgi:hypothetical protein